MEREHHLHAHRRLGEHFVPGVAVPATLRASFAQRSRTPLLVAITLPLKGRAPSLELLATSESSGGFPPERRRTDEGHVDGLCR